VWRKARLPVEEVALDPAAGDAAAQLRARFGHHRIDVRQAPLLRAYIAREAESERWLCLVLLHPLAGGQTTLGLIREEVRVHLTGQADRLPPAARTSEEEQEEFFRKLLWDVDEPTAPFGLLEVQGRAIGETRAQVDAGLVRRLRNAAGKLEVSVAAVCHLAWAQVLARTAGRDDVVFGTKNALPVRIPVGEESVETSVRRTEALLAELKRHEHASLALAQRCSGMSATTPLVSALLDYRLGAVEDRQSCLSHPREDRQDCLSSTSELWEGIEELHADRARYPLTLTVDDAGAGLGLTAKVVEPVAATRVCDLMQTALARLVEALETAPATPVRGVDVLPEPERQLVVEEWNATHADYASDRCIHELFEEQVRKTPGAIAVIHEGKTLTYAELNVQANRLAHYLRDLGLKPEGRVAICLEERGIEMIVGMLAILKAGGAFVPLSSLTYTSRWIRRIRASGMAMVLTQGTLAGMFMAAGPGLPILDLSAEIPPWATRTETNPERSVVGVNPGNLAYLVYTSGSTGIPKAVMVEHRGLCNLVVAQDGFAVTPESRVLQFASFSFDACIFEVLMALCRGASLHIPPQGDMPLPEALTRTVARYGITHATVSPAMLASLDRKVDLASVHTMVVAGEALPEAVVKRWARGRRLINAYGPTEATVWATMYDCRVEDPGPPPIGRPIANVKIYILDAHGQPSPVGVAGELFIAGAGVARGYLQKPDLTAERFVRDPFSGDPKARMYKTGDLGKWLPDGNIEFLGRNDFQVKVRGFRIELGDIEARLLEHPGVREAVVIAREDTPGDKRLVAYYTPAVANGNGEAAVEAEALRTFLSQSLADYMVPAAYVRLERFQLTPSAKVDRKALPVP
jgi:amino acid adenylation domain-containing protein